MALTYTREPFDRAAYLRRDDARMHALLACPAARIVPVWNERHLVDDTPRLQTLKAPSDSANATFLGLAGEVPWFALALPASEQPPALDVPGSFRVLNEVVALLPGDEAAILAYARAMILWRTNHRHCARCGAPAAIAEWGHSSTCTNAVCAHRTFPRTDPVVITLITQGDKCLLGRQAAWPAGFYSCIAGFVEPGETLETAVRREGLEETGVKIGEVHYVASQPWPFPASLMLGFRAEALTTDLQHRDDELEDCRWFSKADVRAFGERGEDSPGFKLPPRFAIARTLIDGWLAE